MITRYDRRAFLGTTAALGAATALLPYMSFAAEGTLTADLGKVSDLDSGDPVFVNALFRDDSGKQADELKLYVRAVKTGDSLDWVVLSAICTHLKCKIKYDGGEKKFVCPCHKSTFDLSGKVLKKPAKKPLPEYSDCVHEENGQLIMTK
ncbi:MAG: ubiquinol-cytochrome c reductase iron-sulfur subunit [bacterium]|nr:ubiquinol-cytochrome c reductase iron-sulfur subunit [bacterium]